MLRSARLPNILQIKAGDLNNVLKAKSPYIVLCNCNNINERNVNTLANQLLFDNELEAFEARKKLLAKKEYITSRFLIKTIISHHFNISYHTIQLCFNHNLKKLQAIVNNQPLPINISLAHSKGMVFFVINEENVLLGVDVEYQDSNRDITAVSESYFHPSETKSLTKNDHTRFYQLWTLKESLAKATGQSIFELLGQNTIQIIKNFHYQLGLHDGFQCAVLQNRKVLPSPGYLLNLESALLHYAE